MKRISVIFGTRPEVIKLVPVIEALRNQPSVACSVCSTSQHEELLEQALEFFSVSPDAVLDVMRSGQSLAELTARLLPALDAYLAESAPDFVLVQGDTATTFAASLAAFYRQIPVGHVEAGLRSGDLTAPWPEEANRLMVSRLAALHFAPTIANRQALIDEGISETRVFVTGNTIVDALQSVLGRLELGAKFWSRMQVPELNDPNIPMVLITCHRRENLGERLRSVSAAVHRLATRHPEVLFVWPLHPNPRVSDPVRSCLLSGPTNIRLIDAQVYPNFVALMRRAVVILSDSGGVQEEAPSLGVPVLVLRDRTERQEALAAGCVELVGTSYQMIVERVEQLLRDPTDSTSTENVNPFGDGRSGLRIAELAVAYVSEGAPSPIATT